MINDGKKRVRSEEGVLQLKDTGRDYRKQKQ